LRQPNPNWPADAARPERYFKYTPVDKVQEAGSRMQEAGGKGQDVEDEEADVGGVLQEAEDEWVDEESAE